MSTAKKNDYFTPEESTKAEQELRRMAADDAYNTAPSYSANTELYPDNRIPFVDKHMNYMRKHMTINPEHYIANLRLMTRVR